MTDTLLCAEVRAVKGFQKEFWAAILPTKNNVTEMAIKPNAKATGQWTEPW